MLALWLQEAFGNLVIALRRTARLRPSREWRVPGTGFILAAVDPEDSEHIARLTRIAGEPIQFPAIPPELMSQISPDVSGCLFVRAEVLSRYYPGSALFVAKLK